ncbi:MAG TPA: cytochrome c oxidase assembly protein [Candidatus Sulfotelmatobacter sp.]|nr:cytochrome c oxidase assembly protein [Candidatus Sulfotelmatobacter sp.]
MSGPRSNRRVVLSLVMIAVGMGCLAYASVPLYRVFCQVTGFGGTTQRATAAPAQEAARLVTVRFDANVADMPWQFEPDQREVTVHVGESTLATFHAHNIAHTAVTGTATFNVTPTKVGQYFDKIQCFCFTEQTLKAGETAALPVSFFVDPAILEDHNLDDVNTITLSYTFFRAKNQPVDRVATGPAASATVKR